MSCPQKLLALGNFGQRCFVDTGPNRLVMTH